MFDAFVKWVDAFGDILNIIVLKDNTDVVLEAVFKKNQLIREISKYDFEILGSNDREIYLKVNGKDYTIQAKDFEFDKELDL